MEIQAKKHLTVIKNALKTRYEQLRKENITLDDILKERPQSELQLIHEINEHEMCTINELNAAIDYELQK